MLGRMLNVPPKVMLFECRQGILRWGLLLPVSADVPFWADVALRPGGTFASEAEGLRALRALEASIDGAGHRRPASLVISDAAQALARTLEGAA